MILTILKLVWKPVLLVGIVGFVYWKVANAFDDYKTMVEERNTTITKVTVARDRAIVEAAAAQAAVYEIKANAQRMELLLESSLQRQDEIRAEAKAQREVFEGHNFEALTKAKPGLIEKLANKATQKRMDSFEDAFNN
jgi:hypothetical protein